jgi:hypothetical protein
MNRFVRAQDYAALEAEYRQLCLKLAGEQVTKQIDELPFDRYEQKLHKSLKQAIARLASEQGRSLFFRLTPHIKWEGKFHVRAEAPNITEPREEFSYERPLAAISGPSLSAAAAVYARQPLFSGTQPSGAALYLIARTVAAFGRCLSEFSITVPVYFSCVYAVFRMKGQSAPGSDDQSSG